MSVRIKETGKIGSGEADDCLGSGGEFNPLFEKDKYGNPNPYQDPARGRIEDFNFGEGTELTVEPTDLLQNLTGKDGILGRSIELTDGEDFTACCVIARD